MTHQPAKTLFVRPALLLIGAMLVVLGVGAPAVAIVADDAADRVAEEPAEKPSDEPASTQAPPAGDEAIEIAPVPDVLFPTTPPFESPPPKLSPAEFGDGWPAAAAVAVALLAVLAMALLWRRDEVR